MGFLSVAIDSKVATVTINHPPVNVLSGEVLKELEATMAAPGFYDDRAVAERAASQHQTLMWEVGDLMHQWEMLQAESTAN